MENRYDTYAKRQEIRQALQAAENKKRIFDILGVSGKELSSCRATILELLDELDDADALLQAVQTSCEREHAGLQRENARLRASIADCQKNMQPTPSMSTTEGLDSLPLSERVRSLLVDAGFGTIQDLFAFNTHDFLNIRGFGVNALMNMNHALSERGLPPLSEGTPTSPFVYTEERPLHDVDEPVEALKLHPHVEFLLKALGKNTIRSVLLMTSSEEHKIFDVRAQALRYLWNVLALISFPERVASGKVASEYGDSELLSRYPCYLRLSTYTRNVLTAKGILTIGELLAHSRVSLRELTGFTFATIDPIQTKLKKYNLRLRRKGKELDSH